MVRIPHPHLPHLSLTKVRVFRLFLLLVVFSGLVLYAVFRSHRFQELMRKKSEKVLSEMAGRPVTIGGFDLALVPPAFVVKNVTVANDPRGLPGSAFSAAEIELRGIPRISAERIDLSKVRVLAPRLVFEIFPDGSSNFSSLIASLPKSRSGGIDIRLGEAVIQRGTYRFREWRGALDVLFKDAALVARSGTFSRVTHATFLCRSVKLKLGEGEVLDFALRTDAVLQPGRIHLNRVTLRSPALSIDGSGGIEDLKNPVFTLAARTSFTGATLRKHFGVDIPLEGEVKARATLRVPTGKPFQVFGKFEVPAARFGPFPMAGAGTMRVDPSGLLIDLPSVEYAGGTFEAAVRVSRFDHPPVPVRIDVRGRNIDFEQFFADIDLPGTGLMARADLDTTLTFGPGGPEHADGVGTLTLHPDQGRRSAVRGRHALPVAGGGPLLIRDGKILFDATPLVTAGGVELTLDGSLALGTWVPDFWIALGAVDLAEVERIADNFYPAIQKSPLTPPLKLGGRGDLTAHFSRAFDNPLVTGKLVAPEFVLKGVPFGEVEADFTVDRDVLTLSPFTARSGGAQLEATGHFGWGKKFGDQYLLDDFVLDLERWPIEKVLRFLSFDLPLEGPLTGRIPLSGVTPGLAGAGEVVWRGAKAWGQQLDRVEGLLAFEGDRLRLSHVTASLGAGRLKGDGFYRYDGGYGFDLTADGIPLEGMVGMPEAVPGLQARVSGRLAGKGSLEKPSLETAVTLAGLTYRGRAFGKEVPAVLEGKLAEGEVEGSIEVPGGGRLSVRNQKGRSTLKLDVGAVELLAPVFGIPSDAGLAGKIRAEAELDLGEDGRVRALRGKIASGDVTLYGRALEIPGGTFALEADRWTFSGISVREKATGLVAAQIALSGSIGTVSPRPLDLLVEGGFDASFLKAFLPKGDVSGPIAVNLRIGGTDEEPVFTGRATLNGIDFVPEGGGTPVEALSGTLSFTPGRVSTAGMTLRFDGGVELSGSVGLSGVVPSGIRLNAHLTRVKTQPFPGFRAAVSGDLVFVGDTALKTVRGDLTMVSGIYDEDLKLGLGTILGRLGSQTERIPAPTALDPVTLEIRIDVPPTAIDIRNNVARMKAGGELFVRGTWGRPLLTGQLEAEDGGRMTLRGLRYEVLKGKILFVSPYRIDPYFELETRVDVKDYRVTVSLSGTMSRIVPRFSSDPPLSEAQIISLLTTGEVPTSTGGAPALGQAPVSTEQSIAQATRELLTSLATDAAASRTKELLRLDRLQIDPIFIGSSFDATRLTIGKNISQDLSVTYSYKASSNQEQVIQLEYQVSRDAFLQFVRDEVGIYSVDLKIRQRLR